MENMILPDINSVLGRRSLAKMLMRLFALWRLAPPEQISLLGLAESDIGCLEDLGSGGPLIDSEDMLSRAGILLSIHKNLRLLYGVPLAYDWVKRPHSSFTPTPLTVMLSGFEGLQSVHRYLDSEVHDFVIT